MQKSVLMGLVALWNRMKNLTKAASLVALFPLVLARRPINPFEPSKMKVGNKVVLIPVAYSEISETSEPVYSSFPPSFPIGLPLFGAYESFGRAALNERSQGGAFI